MLGSGREAVKVRPGAGSGRYARRILALIQVGLEIVGVEFQDGVFQGGDVDFVRPVPLPVLQQLKEGDQLTSKG